FLSSRRRHTSFSRDWSSDVCSSDLPGEGASHVSNPRVGNTNRQRRAQPSHPPRRGRAEERVRGVTPTIRIQAAEHVLRRRGEAGTVVAAWADTAPNVGFTALRSEELRGATDP